MTNVEQIITVAARFVAGAGSCDRDTAESQVALITERSGKPPESVLLDVAAELVRVKTMLAAIRRQDRG